ncbi:MAG: guanylate kinase [Ignavibacteria bacterium CG_4_8_14_3_um_filter_37_9]|nr:guanylate kinase [Ignavibacteria bacterium]PIP76905.1 MAG: guanylate kinase [Ignavibacteria bacterium CG22_combo_CG10-13_8_21_14_all_37_15]PIS45420.1 MAG: guanylate kinase [Ignavibacteria bacterium CG08_land_8_20_14_0_20_37_9]PIW98357.1 MAG: guanylate kinase [Ignavibacteria bacterium CG_4_8_14_3_um_filter_37_9]PIX93789.1 MAG: guanylate kinase [Ignavibacteria bacterium CG_4_10_14_3_um_filter_37_18]PJC60870.1 MAG: guanylate kinase [Ignavibacteria bacterium CG_4_9_14_0_2_um_filter_37_13]
MFVITAPSGTGKTTIIRSILKKLPDVVYSISATTRGKRANEKDGVDYFFIDEAAFQQKISDHQFVEWEKVYDYYYGTPKFFVEKVISEGNSILLELEVKGALSIKKVFPQAIMIFLLPPSLEILEKRLRERKTESEEDFQKRIERAKMELSLKDKFDYFIVNNNLNTAILELKEVIEKITNKEMN